MRLVKAIITPLPAAKPSFFITIGKSQVSTYCNASLRELTFIFCWEYDICPLIAWQIILNLQFEPHLVLGQTL